jgi:hypothetical protein
MKTSIPATMRTKLSSLRQALKDVRRIAQSSLDGGMSPLIPFLY